MRGDQFALTILLQNLLANAGKYTPQGGRVQVTVESDGTSASLRVEDSGPGIAEDERERVFERFYRVGGDRHTSLAAGCGLGLSIVQHIAQLHHARITLGESSLGQGLSVQVTFPAINHDENSNDRIARAANVQKENSVD